MSMTRYNDADDEFFSHPFRALLNPRFFGPSLLTAPSEAASTPTPIRVDVLEKTDKYVVRADIPGIPKKNVNLSVEGDLLTLAVDGGKDESKEEDRKGIKVHRIERSRTYERRMIRLPESADTEQISAKVDQGVLDVEIKKKKTAGGSRQISISGSE